MKTYNNINEISDAEILAVLGNCMSNIFDEEKIAKKEAKAKARKVKRHVEDTIAFHICLQSIEKGLKK